MLRSFISMQLRDGNPIECKQRLTKAAAVPTKDIVSDSRQSCIKRARQMSIMVSIELASVSAMQCPPIALISKFDKSRDRCKTVPQPLPLPCTCQHSQHMFGQAAVLTQSRNLSAAPSCKGDWRAEAHNQISSSWHIAGTLYVC